MNDNSLGSLNPRLFKPEFPRSSGYDPHWLIANTMGPHALWLAEWLSQRLELTPGMRGLDLGCGKALSSIFLAKEFGVNVWAADYLIKPHENMEQIKEEGVSNLRFPFSYAIHANHFFEDR